MSFNSLYWVQVAVEVPPRNYALYFQFPLLGSTVNVAPSGMSIGVAFNSLYWVHFSVLVQYSGLRLSFNSLYWVLLP